MDLHGNMNDIVYGMENNKETSFDDLPDDILINIFKLLDLPSRLRLRGVNKRLDNIYHSVKNEFKEIKVKISEDKYELTLDTFDGEYCLNSLDFNPLENILRGLVNTSVEELILFADEMPSENVSSLINLFSNFDINQLIVAGDVDELRIPQVSLSTLLSLAENARDICLQIKCDSVSIQDLCIIRKTMLEGNCKLKSFCVDVDVEVSKNFVEECFGVTIEFEINEHDRRTKIFRTSNESVELFSSNVFYGDLIHFENDFLTAAKPGGFYPCIWFSKGVAKPDNVDKVQMNHLYFF